MNSVAFLVIAIITLSGGLAAATLRKLIHAALCLVIAFVGLAASFFLLGAEFFGLVQRRMAPAALTGAAPLSH